MSIVVENVSFKSEGYKLLGRLYRPSAAGAHPAVSICHGYPGDTKNMDLAEELALNGIVCLIPHYRGAWGSEGTYSFLALDRSAKDAVEFLVSQPSVDPERVGLMGHSMGAIPLAKRLSADHRMRTGVFMSPAADIGEWSSKIVLDNIVPVFLNMGKGKLNGLDADVIRSEIPRLVEAFNPNKVIRNVKVPTLFIVGSNDTVTPPELCRTLYESANEPKRWLLIEGADHTFSEHRIPLIKSIVEWLEENL